MNLVISRSERHESQINCFQKKLSYKYPCDLVEPGERCEITVEIKDQPTSIEINNHMDEEDLPFGTYHLNRIFCTCPRLKVSQKIQTLFRKKVRDRNCRFHNKEFDVYLRSDQPISFKKL